MNAGAALVTNITSTFPIVVTAAGHNFIDGTIVSIEVPIIDGMQTEDSPSWLRQPQFFVGAITYIDVNTFSMRSNAAGLSAFGGAIPVYAIPVTYSCSAYPNPTLVFQPAYRLIVAITNARNALVTTSFAHGYMTGLIVRLVIPPACGMTQANQLVGTITITSDNTFTIDIDTTDFAPFTIPLPTRSSNPHVDICALVVPIGQDSSMIYQATRNILPT